MLYFIMTLNFSTFSIKHILTAGRDVRETTAEEAQKLTMRTGGAERSSRQVLNLSHPRAAQSVIPTQGAAPDNSSSKACRSEAPLDSTGE